MLSLIGFRRAATEIDSALPEIFSLGIACDLFTRLNVSSLYKKILTDCIVRTQGIAEEVKPALWDNCLGSELDRGLISLLADAMARKKELYLIWNLGVLRQANNEEQVRIKSDYVKSGKSAIGTYISFKNYELSDILFIYAAMEYSSLASMSTMMNLAKAIQFKMDSMRKSVGAVDKDEVLAQCVSIANALKIGRPVAIDGEDEITTAQLDMDPTTKAVAFLDSKRAYYTGMPISYITGEQTGGIGASGENDTNAVQRGLEPYWFSIIQPSLQSIFSLSVTFKTQVFRQVDAGLNALKTFELVSDDLLSLDNKRLIVSGLLDVENDVEGVEREVVEQVVEEPASDDNSQPD